MAVSNPAAQEHLIEEDCSHWGESNADPLVPEDSAETRRGVCVAVATVLISIPALLGSWCWPLLLAGLFSGLSASLDTPGAKALAHSLTWGINLAIFTNMLQFVGRSCANKSKTIPYRHRWGPFWCIFVGMIGVMGDLTRHLFNDAFGVMPMFNHDGSYSIYGIVLTLIGTWTGAILLMGGILWETRLLVKVVRKFRAARRAPPRGPALA